MTQQFDVQPMINAINSQPDPYPAALSLMHLLLDRSRLDLESRLDLLLDLSNIFDGLPPSPRAMAVPIPKSARSKGGKHA